MKNLLFLLSLLALTLSYDPELWLNETMKTGFIGIGDDYNLFFWLFKARNLNKQAPLILFLQGGPACSDVEVVLNECGPYRIDQSNHTKLEKNLYSWTAEADVLFVDSPLGVGFSECSDPFRWPIVEEGVSDDLYTFLTKFFDQETEYQKRPFVLAGQSYAGHYLGKFAPYLHEKKNEHINLKGLILGDPWLSPMNQLVKNPGYAYDHDLINILVYDTAVATYATCIGCIAVSNLPGAAYYCSAAFFEISGSPYNFNIFDIRKKCAPGEPFCYNLTYIDEFMAQERVKKDLVGKQMDWSQCNNIEMEKFLGADYYFDYSDGITTLLKAKIPVLLYFGKDDFIVNTDGGRNMVENLEWTYAEDFYKNSWVDYKFGGKSKGRYIEDQGLKYVEIDECGHFATIDQPAVTQDLVNTFLKEHA